MKPNYIQLQASSEDGKRWIAEITGDDEVFRVKRDFQPEMPGGIWEIYDGWYQIHGQVANVTPFQKEYVWVRNGQMERNLSFRDVMYHLDEIKAAEPQRLERIKQQIVAEFNDIHLAAPYEQVGEELERQKEDLDFIENSSQAIAGLATLRKRKNEMIKQYQKIYENWQDEW